MSFLIELSNKTQVACCLKWSVFHDQPLNRKELIQNDFKEINSLYQNATGDSVTGRVQNLVNDFLQIGYALELEFPVRGIPSLGLAVNKYALRLGAHNWAAFIEIDEGFWFCSAHDGLIDTDTDIVVSREELLELYAKISKNVVQTHTYILNDGSISDADINFDPQVDLQSCFGEKSIKVKPVELNVGYYIKCISVLILLLCLVFAAWFYIPAANDSFKNQKTKIEIKSENLDIKKQEAAVDYSVILAAEKPTEMLMNCLNTLKPELFSPASWIVEELTCQQDGVTASYKYDPDKSQNALILKSILPNARIEMAGSRVGLTIPLITNKKKQIQIPYDTQQVQYAIYGSIQALGLTVAISEISNLNNDSQSESLKTVTNSKLFKFVITGSGNAMKASAILDHVPTARITRVNLMDASKTEIEGIVYAKI